MSYRSRLLLFLLPLLCFRSSHVEAVRGSAPYRRYPLDGYKINVFNVFEDHSQRIRVVCQKLVSAKKKEAKDTLAHSEWVTWNVEEYSWRTSYICYVEWNLNNPQKNTKASFFPFRAKHVSNCYSSGVMKVCNWGLKEDGVYYKPSLIADFEFYFVWNYIIRPQR